ncbi:glycerol transporter [Bifidobacterium goeldii]|uniref:Glycerol transporter n=1 Tax=Bifidobacterium goeldii TaxID=2306975 RepID=A0A430FLR5_9BIFI|nr:aquaporin [Bifidobacterium goeldii]RSX53777.1 glycerol transporter [Bifidobacterium goeldii]
MTEFMAETAETQNVTRHEVHTLDQRRGAQSPILRVGAEFAGSFLICFAIYVLSSFGIAIYGLDLAALALGTALIYTAVTTVFASLSGGQFNPAVTVAAMLTGKTNVPTGVLYVIAQVLGGLGAGAVLRFVLPTSDSVTAKTWMTPVVNGFDAGSVSNSTISQAGLSFGITLAIIVEVVASVIIVACAMRLTDNDGRPTHGYALAMGVTYGAGAAISYPITGAALNPARATGIAVFAQNQGLTTQPLSQLWVFWVAPVLAAAIVALAMIIAEIVTTRTPKKKAAHDESADATQTDEVPADGEISESSDDNGADSESTKSIDVTSGEEA